MDAVAAGWGADQSLSPWLEKNVKLNHENITDFLNYMIINQITKRSGNGNGNSK